MTTKIANPMVAGPLLASVNPVDVTASRALTAADFGFDILRVNAAGVVALTLPTMAALALAATPGQVRALVIENVGAGIPTFAGATSSTTINAVAGPTTVLPLGGAPVTGGYYALVEKAVAGNDWTLQ